MKNKGVLYLLLAGFFYATYGVFSRIMGKDFTNFYQAWSRGIIVSAVFVTLGIVNKGFVKIKKEDFKWLFLAVCGGALTITPFYVAAVNIPIGTALLVFYAANTTLSYILGYILFKEHLNKTKMFSLILALVGLLFIYNENIRLYDMKYLAYSAISGLLFTCMLMFSKKVNKKYSVFQINSIISIGTVIINLVISLLMKEKYYLDLLSTSWYANLGYAAAQILALLFVVTGFKTVEAQIGSIILLSEVVFTLILGFFIFSEFPGTLSLFGGLLIFSAMLIPNIKLSSVIVKKLR